MTRLIIFSTDGSAIFYWLAFNKLFFSSEIRHQNRKDKIRLFIGTIYGLNLISNNRQREPALTRDSCLDDRFL